MPSHWTYIDACDDPLLTQGDILGRTDALVELMRSVHSHFCDEKYLGFLVVTQTCDLVLRKGNCTADYINLAVVRSLGSVLSMLLDKLCSTEINGVYIEDHKSQARQLLEGILNQNEQANGVFYLHPDSDAGVIEHSVALLRVTIAVRRQHYDLLKEARKGRLEPVYAGKLGWLAGNLFSRVATPDWKEQPNGSEEFNRLVDEFLNRDETSQKRHWIDPKRLRQAKNLNIDLANTAPEDSIAKLAEIELKSPKQEAIERVRAHATDLLRQENAQTIEKLTKRLDDDQIFTAACRRQ